MRLLRAAVLSLVVAGGMVTGVEAQRPPEQLLASALAVLDSSETERGIELLRQLLATLPASASRDVRLTALIRAAEVSAALGLTDSARGYFRAAVRLEPFVILSVENVNPDVVALFTATKRLTAVVGVRIPADTAIKPDSGGLRLRVSVGLPGDVRIRVTSTEVTRPDSLTIGVGHVDSLGWVMIPLMANASSPLSAGTYDVIAQFTGPAGASAESRGRIEVSRMAVDTLAHEAPPAVAQFRPEFGKGGVSASSLLFGAVFGGAAVALPALLTNGRLGNSAVDVRAVGVGATIGLAGVVGALVGKHDVTIAENVEFNRGIRAAWQERDRGFAARNATTLKFARLRIRLAAGQ
jgi:hypothetical protein